MENAVVNRRQLLKGMGLATLGGGAITALSPTAALADNNHEGSSSPVGAWKLTIVDKSGPSPTTTPGVAVFNPGGGLETTDTQGPGVSLGRWVGQGEGQFRGTFDAFVFDPSSHAFQGTVEVRIKGRVQGDSLTGDFAFDFFDPTGTKPPGAPTGHGTFSGTRFQVKPL
jgi:hypothetical protein